jgi:hypothetical protein
MTSAYQESEGRSLPEEENSSNDRDEIERKCQDISDDVILTYSATVPNNDTLTMAYGTEP